MNLDRAVLVLAGTMTCSAPSWSPITGFCPAAVIFRRLGVSGGCAFR